MAHGLSTSSKSIRLAQLLNRRVIHTSYLRSTIYFLIALALGLAFYLIATNVH